MDKQALLAILERAQRGALTPTDVDTLHALFRPILIGPPEPLSGEYALHREPSNPRVGSVATVEIDFTTDRATGPEFSVQASYHLPGGRVMRDRRRSFHFTGNVVPMVRALWEVGFDVVLRAQQNEPAVTRLSVRCETLDAFWFGIVSTIAIIIGYELKVTVCGAHTSPAGDR